MAHSRESSSDSTSAGSSYKLILEHVFSYPGSYELPLRTMYTLNCISRAQPLPQSISRPSTPLQSSPSSPISPAFPEASSIQAATAQFTSCLFNRVARLPSQPCSLPPVFINSFLRRCFPSELNLVDFTQALTALDYLKDLETRRRRELASALERLGIQRDNVTGDAEKLSQITHPTVAQWIATIEKSEKKVEAFYTSVYVALRRWILINELSLTPFNKHNCLAMLNTLYPPTSTSRPTTKLTPEVLKRQRDIFFKYIGAVECKGVGVLTPLLVQNSNPGDENGWPRVRTILDNYLRVTTGLMDECLQISNLENFIASRDGQQVWSKRQDRKTDSGVSFGSNEGNVIGVVEDRKRGGDVEVGEEPPAKKHYSTIERIARELKRLRTRTKSHTSLQSMETERKKEVEQVDAMDTTAEGGDTIEPLPNINRNIATEESHEAEPTQSRSPIGVMKRLRSFGDVRSLSRSPSLAPRGGGRSALLSGSFDLRRDDQSLAERIVTVPGASHSFG